MSVFAANSDVAVNSDAMVGPEGWRGLGWYRACSRAKLWELLMKRIVSTAPYFRKALMFTCFAIAGFVFFGCASTSSNNASNADLQKRKQALANSDLLIVPGQRIGPVRLGMGWDEVIAALGEPDYSYTNTGDPLKIDTQMRYFSLNLQIFFTTSAAPTVNSIKVLVYPSNGRTLTFGSMTWADLEPVTTAFKTAEGIGLGASSFDVARTYGTYEAVGMVGMNYKQPPLFFNVTKDHRVWAIITRRN